MAGPAPAPVAARLRLARSAPSLLGALGLHLLALTLLAPSARHTPWSGAWA